MYLPEYFEIKDKNKISNFINANNFADLVTNRGGTIISNKVPFLFDEGENMLYGHFSRANTQLIDLEKNENVLVIFSGAHSYISPRWYVSNNMVPTWNFQTVQVRGKSSIISNSKLISMLDKLSNFHESDSEKPWSIDEVDSKKLDYMLKAIVGFKIEMSEVKFKSKMSQNRGEADRNSLIKALKKQDSKNAIDVANIINCYARE